ncbi:MAG: hypothetical protein JWQ10_4081 [Herbaspirillum sp.]|nr:hypothetical protein [Herbaspirillum sp.]
MSKIAFEGHSIEPASYQDEDMPGHWFPSAEVMTPDGESKVVRLVPVRGVTKAQADAEAMNEAKHRITHNNL